MALRGLLAAHLHTILQQLLQHQHQRGGTSELVRNRNVEASYGAVVAAHAAPDNNQVCVMVATCIWTLQFPS